MPKLSLLKRVVVSFRCHITLFYVTAGELVNHLLVLCQYFGEYAGKEICAFRYRISFRQKRIAFVTPAFILSECPISTVTWRVLENPAEGIFRLNQLSKFCFITKSTAGTCCSLGLIGPANHQDDIFSNR